LVLMTTATTTPGTSMAAFNMKERKEPTFVQFADGEEVSGILLRIDRMQVGQQKQIANRYTLRDLDGEMYSFLGTYQIDTKLHTTDVGHYVQVRCEGTDSSVTRNGNAMKKFKVSVSEKPYAPKQGRKLEDGTYITDEDIPF